MSYGEDDTGWQDAQISIYALEAAEKEIEQIRTTITLIALMVKIAIDGLNSRMMHNNVDLPADFVKAFSDDFEVTYCEEAIARAQKVIDDYHAQGSE